MVIVWSFFDGVVLLFHSLLTRTGAVCIRLANSGNPIVDLSTTMFFVVVYFGACRVARLDSENSVTGGWRRANQH